MTSKIVAEGITSKFRQKYSLPSDSLRKNVHARHMYGSLKHMQAKMRLVDCVIEVHDARIPFTGRNLMFKRTLYGENFKPHVLVLNKMDLIDKKHFASIENQLFADDPSLRHLIWADCKRRTKSALEQVMQAVKARIIGMPRYNREYKTEYNLMVIGVPNVGKSSLINAMRSLFANLSRMASPVGPTPGVTRSVMTKVAIHENPKIYILDTPGILMPQLGNDETIMKLTLCATIADHLVGEQNLADYVLYFLNKHNYLQYVHFCGLPEPTDSIFNALYHLAATNNITRLVKEGSGCSRNVPDIAGAAALFVATFRKGGLCPQFLDLDILDKLERE